MRISSAITAAAMLVALLPAQTPPVRDPARETQTAAPAGTASLDGVAIISINGQASPVRRAKVTLQAEGRAAQTIDSDTLGQFHFDRLPAATYKILVDKPGFVPIGHDPVVNILDGQAAKLTVAMQRGAAIDGRLLNADGEPAMGLTVSAVRLGYGPYGKKAVALRQTTTDDLGRFRLHTLLPGEYYIEAAPDPLRMLNASPVPGVVPAKRTYYAGTSRLNEARSIVLEPGQQLSNMSFTMTNGALARVSAIVTTASDKPPATFSVRVQRVGAPPGEVRCLLPGRPGALLCENVPPGDFWLLVAARATVDAATEFAAMPISVDGRDLTNLPVTTMPGTPVGGRVEVEGAVALPPSVLIAALETEFELPGPAPTAGSSGTPPVAVSADGAFTFASVIGQRLFRFTRLPDGWALKSVTLDGIDITDTPTAFAPSERTPLLRVVVTPRTGSVEGTVLDVDGKPAVGVRAIVFSDDERHWMARSRFIRSIEAGVAGRYDIRGLLPGNYRVAFVDGLADGAWEDPEVLARLRPLSASIVIAAAGRVTLNGRIR